MENAMNSTPEMRCSPERPAIRQRITACLMRAEAIGLQELVARTGCAAHDCAATLDDLAANGKVRELRPVAAQPGRHEAYYRLVRPSDRDWLWEQTVDRGRPVPHSRLRSLEETELRGVTTAAPRCPRGHRQPWNLRRLIPLPGAG